MVNLIKKLAGGNSNKAGSCCGVEIKEVSAEKNEEASSDSCCSTDAATSDSCCSTETNANNSSCCG